MSVAPPPPRLQVLRLFGGGGVGGGCVSTSRCTGRLHGLSIMTCGPGLLAKRHPPLPNGTHPWKGAACMSLCAHILLLST